MKRMEPLTGIQIQKVLDATEDVRDRLMILLASNHAMRCREIALLQIGSTVGLARRAGHVGSGGISGRIGSDVNLKDRTITVHRLKGSKTTTEALQSGEFELLKKWIAIKPLSPYLFPSDRKSSGYSEMSRQSVYNVFVKAAKRAGIPDASRAPHAYKHSLGQRMADAGASAKLIQLALGHTSLEASGQYYSHPQSFVDAEKSRILSL
jgi:integrase